MKKYFVFFLIVLLVSCTKVDCKTKEYTSDGKCCNYVCDIECTNGYKEDTCKCECNEALTGQATDTGIDDIFGDSGDINPPTIPN